MATTAERVRPLLGLETDAELGRRFGVSRERIRQIRAREGIQRWGETWREKARPLLGVRPDGVVAAEVGVCAFMVYRERKALGVAPCPRARVWLKQERVARARAAWEQRCAGMAWGEVVAASGYKSKMAAAREVLWIARRLGWAGVEAAKKRKPYRLAKKGGSCGGPKS